MVNFTQSVVIANITMTITFFGIITGFLFKFNSSIVSRLSRLESDHKHLKSQFKSLASDFKQTRDDVKTLTNDTKDLKKSIQRIEQKLI